MSDNDRDKGLYDKFCVHRRDNRDKPGGDREHADYFVLDLAYDPHALIAIEAYSRSCRDEYPQLAEDLDQKIEDYFRYG